MEKLTIIDRWDESFFDKFIGFRNRIHKNIPVSFVENTSDYTKFFAVGSVFETDYLWKAKCS